MSENAEAQRAAPNSPATNRGLEGMATPGIALWVQQIQATEPPQT